MEKSEAINKERFQKRKISRGASSSSGKRARESQAELVQGSSTRGVSTRQGEVPECPHYHRRHLGMCR